jgi:hypothetical protein
MKTLIAILMFLILIGPGCTTVNTNQIEGVWKVVGWDMYKADTLFWSMSSNLQGDEILIFAKEYFNWAGRYKLDTTYWNNFGGGTYTLDGNNMEQEILYYGSTARVGQKVRLLWEYKNDTAVQKWPMDENWNLENGSYSIQKWIRLE